MRASELLWMAVAVALTACGPAEPRALCEYAELEGTCALVEAGDLEPTGSPGRIRARYRVIQSGMPELGNHVVMLAECNPERHRTTILFLRDHKSVKCSLGVRTRGTNCPQTRIVMGLPPAPRELGLEYEARVVSDVRAQPDEEQPFGEGRRTAWP